MPEVIGERSNAGRTAHCGAAVAEAEAELGNRISRAKLRVAANHARFNLHFLCLAIELGE